MVARPTAADWHRLRESERRLLDSVDFTGVCHDLSIAGERFHYLEIGHPSLPPLVLLHGRGSASALWFPIFPWLARYRHIYALDMRGWGLADRQPFPGRSGEDAIQWWRDGVLAMIDALGLTQFDLFGHSLGGLISLAIVLERPAAIKRLILENPAGFDDRAKFLLRLYFNLEPERLMRMVPRPLFTAWHRRRAHFRKMPSPQQDRLIDFLHTLSIFPGTHASGSAASNAYASLWGVNHTFRDQVRYIQTATCVLWGEEDGIIPLNGSRPVLETMPLVRLDTFKASGHFPHIDCPDAFAEAVQIFLTAEDTASLGGAGRDSAPDNYTTH